MIRINISQISYLELFNKLLKTEQTEDLLLL